MPGTPEVCWLDDHLPRRFRLRFAGPVPVGDTVEVDDRGDEPLVIRSAGTLLDEEGEVYPVVRVDATRRPELRALVDVIAREGAGDLATFAELRLGDRGRRVVRLVSRLTTPVSETWSIDFALPGFEDLLRLASERGGLVVSFLVDGRVDGRDDDRDDDQWLGVNLDGAALEPLLT